MPKPRSPFDVTLAPERKQWLVNWLSEEIDAALSARDRLIGDGQLIEYWRSLYKQGRTRIAKDAPWPGAADLTSYIGTEKVDTLRSNVVRSIFVEPMWAVEGKGESASRAAIVEEFHQWVMESQERLQGKLQKALHNSLIERVGILETYEASDVLKTQRKQHVRVKADPATGLPILNEKGDPQPERDVSGAFVPAEPGEAAAEVVQEDKRIQHLGPRHRVIAIRDFVVLPGHAQDRDDIWGYAKRCWIRLPTLQAREKDGIYQNVEALGIGEERSLTEEQRAGGQELAPQKGSSVEKEIWEVNVKCDLDEDGYEEWYKVTLSTTHKALLRVQRDDVNLCPYTLFIPFPDPDSAWAGFSYLGDKLWTTIEEHTSQRNMAADRTALKTNAPLMIAEGETWDPQSEPWGPGQRMSVRSLDGVKPFDVPDVPNSLVMQMRDTVNAAERLSGVPDMMSGVQATNQRTLGENQMVMGGANARAEEVVRNIQESLEELGALRHALWMRALAGQAQGMEAPSSVVDALKERQASLSDGRFTAEALRGEFRFKPRGSVESANPERQKQEFSNFLNTVGMLAKASPAYQMWLSHPKTIKALASYAIRLFKFPDRTAMLEALQEILQPPKPDPMAMGGAMPGQPMPGGMPSPMPNGAPGVPPQEGRPPMPAGGAGMPPNVQALLQALQARQGVPQAPVPAQ